MGKYGLKIKNYEAGSIYEYNLGVRDYYESKDAMLTNSLFLDFLLENGLNTYKDKSTRDVICIEFGYGGSSYKHQLKKVNKKLDEAQKSGDARKIESLEFAKNKVEERKDQYIQCSKQDIRKEFYVNGVNIEYISKNNDGEVVKKEVIHYKMLYRTPGKAKKGSCMFINANLYDVAIDFLRMGIQLPYHNAPIVEIGAYASLITSSIVGKVEIDPKNILVLKDVDVFFNTDVISVETDENKHCVAKNIADYKLKNTLFDGQALIDSSIFPDWGDGYILLRHHFCKMASFNAHIQKFFKDYYGENYETAVITDMFGVDHYAKDIQLITTDNAMKWLKFDVSYEYWCQKVGENGNMFGIVKTAHKSKLGDVQRMSYQMVNALDESIMQQVVSTSKQYIEDLKRDNNVFLQFLRDNATFANDFEVLVALCDQDPDFTRSKYFRDRKKNIIQSYIFEFKNGRVIQNADNLVIIGSPYAMLLHSVGEDVHKDDTFVQENGTIQCFTNRFADGEYLAEFRSPFNSKCNLGHLHNVYHEKFNKYFDFGEQIIAINMIGTDFQDRNNGSDQDSDSIYTTNQPEIVEYAKHCYENYSTIVNNIPKEKNSYNNELINYAIIDNNLQAANMAIGLSSNLAQLEQVYTCTFGDKKYHDYTCILSVLAQVAIDNAKRRFDIDLNAEIERIKQDSNVEENKYPTFWFDIKRKDKFSKKMTAKDKAEKKDAMHNPELKCPMNYLGQVEFQDFRSPHKELGMEHFFVKYDLELNRRKSRKVEEIIEKYSLDLYNSKVASEDDDVYLLLREDFDQMIADIKSVYISNTYLGLMSWLIDRAFCITPAIKQNQSIMNARTNKNKVVLLSALYNINKENLLMCFSKNVEKADEI